MKRPQDTSGCDVVMGDWYWAQNLDGSIAGVGKFNYLPQQKIMFDLMGTVRPPESFKAFSSAGDPWLHFIRK